jgi:outer membrane lipopolysaccharide assembly protein LptE/RlpB
MPARSVVLLIALSVAGCGYALAGRGNALPDHIRRIGVPMFENHSNTPELDRILTEAVRQELQGKGRFTIVPDTTGVDAVLSGVVNPVNITVAALTQTRQAQRYLITVNASVEFKDLKEPSKPLWSNPSLRVSDEYDVTGTAAVNDPAAIFSQDQNALSRLAKSFARTLVTSILEAF